jgi:hypothetical protein
VVAVAAVDLEATTDEMTHGQFRAAALAGVLAIKNAVMLITETNRRRLCGMDQRPLRLALTLFNNKLLVDRGQFVSHSTL